ncbi:MAG TPA: hypothetical protein VMD59_01415, partial [Acidimicrobiales bacterium]|nr:hypothetical protein [Acidimicrobiales bacterium]
MSKHIDRNAAWEGSARGGARSAGRRRRTFWRAALASGIGAAGLVTAALPASVALAAPPSFPAAASEVQVPGSTLGLVLEGVTCLSGGDCTAVGASVGAPGASDRSLPVVAAQAAHGWAASTVPLPHEAGSGPAGGLASVSCVVRGACYAVGEYADASSILPLVESDAADGLWQPLAEPPLPSSSASSAPLDGVSCTPDGACLAVGSITTSSRTQAMAGFLTGSAARAGLQLVPAPAGAASGNPNAVLTSVSCVARSCVAVGYYTDAAGTTVPMAVSESNGRFGKAEELAYPPNGGGDLFAVSCAAAGACTAVGYALTAAGGRKEPLYLVDAGGTWQGAQSLPLPSTAGRDAAGTLEGISCAASGTCVIVGSYGTDKQQLAMYAEEDGGS